MTLHVRFANLGLSDLCATFLAVFCCTRIDAQAINGAMPLECGKYRNGLKDPTARA